MADEISLKLEAPGDLPQFVEVMRRAYTAARNGIKGLAAVDPLGAAVEAQMPTA